MEYRDDSCQNYFKMCKVIKVHIENCKIMFTGTMYMHEPVEHVDSTICRAVFRARSTRS